MANNIPEKNLIYSFTSYRGLPYDNVKKIGFYKNNKYVDSFSLNNVYNELVDNDAVAAIEALSKRTAVNEPITITSRDDKSTIDGMYDG